MGLGFGCFLRKGEKTPFLTLAVSKVCSLRKDEDMSEAMLKASSRSSFPALPGAGVPLGAQGGTEGASN